MASNSLKRKLHVHNEALSDTSFGVVQVSLIAVVYQGCQRSILKANLDLDGKAPEVAEWYKGERGDAVPGLHQRVDWAATG